MKIGILCYPTYGGSGVVATELGKGLARLGHQIHFISYRQPARLTHYSENIYYHEVSNVDYPLFEYPPYDTALTSKIVDIVIHEKLDLLHVHYAIPHATIAYMAKQILGTYGIVLPVVTTLHGTDITLVGNNRSFSPVVEFSINKSDGVTAVSESLKKDTFQNFNICRDIKVIYNFIDFERFSRQNKEHFRKAIAPNGEKILVHTSNFRKIKRVDDVVRIFRRVNEVISSKLLLIGDGPERQNLEELCRNEGIAEHVRFLGKQDAIEEILAIGDLFLIPSGSESFGLAALEAMACQVPVISSNIGGLPEVNIHGETGYLCDVGDVEGMANYSIQLLSDDNTLQVFRQNALLQAQRFDIKSVLPEYVSYYEDILERVNGKLISV